MVSKSARRLFIMVVLSLGLAGCASVPPPSNPDNICAIFRQYPDWYDAAAKSRERWGTPIQVMMAIMKFESDYRSDVRPPRTWYLGFIPGPRPSSAYGYAQAQDPVWNEYLDEAGGWGASRDDFAHGIDFIGWYTHKSRKINGVSLWAADKLYLNYHEGWGGYRRGTWKHKAWLQRKSKQVAWLASEYGQQLRGCEASLKKKGFWHWLFG